MWSPPKGRGHMELRVSEEDLRAISPAGRGSTTDSDSDGDGQDLDPLRMRAAALVDDVRFQVVVASAIVLNLVVMLLVTDHPDVPIFRKLNGFFLWVYTAELCLRFFAFRLSVLAPSLHDHSRWFSEPMADEKDLTWNRFDFGIIAFGWCDIVLSILTSSTTRGPLMMSVRTVRMLRVVRLLRIFKFMKPLQDLIKGLLNSLVSVVWVMVLLVTIMLIFAIFATTEFGHHAEGYGDKADTIRDRWGSVSLSFRTLFSFLTLDDWSNMTREVAWPGPENPLPPLVALFAMASLIFYTLLTAFVILSLLTGTMVEEMEKVRTDNEEEELEDNRARMRDGLDNLFARFAAFSEYDAIDKTPGLSDEGLREFLSDPDCKEHLKAIGIDATRYSPEDLFAAFDVNGNSQVRWGELTQGILSLIPKKVSRIKFFKLQATMESCLTLVSQGAQPAQHPSTDEPDRLVAADAKKLMRRTHAVERTIRDFHGDMGSLVEGLQGILAQQGAKGTNGQRRCA